jgi:hypothetical protein
MTGGLREMATETCEQKLATDSLKKVCTSAEKSGYMFSTRGHLSGKTKGRKWHRGDCCNGS